MEFSLGQSSVRSSTVNMVQVPPVTGLGVGGDTGAGVGGATGLGVGGDTGAGVGGATGLAVGGDTGAGVGGATGLGVGAGPGLPQRPFTLPPHSLQATLLIQEVTALTLANTPGYPARAHGIGPHDTTPVSVCVLPFRMTIGPPESPLHTPFPPSPPAHCIVAESKREPQADRHAVSLSLGRTSSSKEDDPTPPGEVPNGCERLTVGR